jgi:hypothetical protein
MVGHAKGQFRIMNPEVAVGDPPQARPTFEVMQEVPVDRQKRYAPAQFCHNM